MAKGKDGEVDQALVRALAHPLRVQILREMEKGPLSPKQLSVLLAEPLGNVSYHTKVLLDCDCIELVSTQPRRGAVEHFYRARPDASIGSRSWLKVPPSLRGDMAAEAIDGLTTRAIAALSAGTFQDREGSAVSWSPLTVDEPGWKEITAILEGVESQFKAVADRSAERLASSSDGFPVVVAVAAFEAEAGKGGQKK
jgi:DNA-binding transcriptional ArsR family regulator